MERTLVRVTVTEFGVWGRVIFSPCRDETFRDGDGGSPEDKTHDGWNKPLEFSPKSLNVGFWAL